MGAICVANFAATIWLSLYLFVSHYRSDSVGAGPGLIWAKLKCEFTNKKVSAQNHPQHNLSRSRFDKLIRIHHQSNLKR